MIAANDSPWFHHGVTEVGPKEFEEYINSIPNDKSKADKQVQGEDNSSETKGEGTIDSEVEKSEEEQKKEHVSASVEDEMKTELTVAVQDKGTVESASFKVEESPVNIPDPQKSGTIESKETKDKAPIRRARHPRKKSGDTSEAEQRLSELLGL